MTTIARNQWYVAAYSRDIGRELFSRTICDEPILFWRTESGAVAALSDRCVHRRYPLSAVPGRLEGDTVVCGYHGFTYDAGGSCVSVPGQKRIPRTARLTSYQVVEQDSFVWGG
jgi:phenylpropionate dioxygenase-like ring-hydroxylating dioxygenase large terminal subunit